MKRAVLLLGLLLPGIALAQESPSFKLTEHAFNAGGHPRGGDAIESASFRLTPGAIGQGAASPLLTSASFGMDGGFIAAYPPPGEVVNVRFSDETTLAWDGERSVGLYNLYQGSVTNPFDSGYGTCQTAGIPAGTTTIPATPPAGEALFILLTAENRLSEEGTKGYDSASTERDNSISCP